jgi:hypothetical protein
MVVSNCVLRIFIFKRFNCIFIFDLEFGSELCPKIQDGHGVMLKLYRTALPTRVAVLLPSATNVSNTGWPASTGTFWTRAMVYLRDKERKRHCFLALAHINLFGTAVEC